jgi:cold shock CspA family protein
MRVPLEIACKGIAHTDEIDALIREEAGKLQRVCNYLMSCRVAVERRQRHQGIGNPYRVRINVTVPPGHELVVRREPSKGDMHDPLGIVIKRAFASAARRLHKLVQQQRGAVKNHPDQQVTAVIHKLFPDQGYGFLRAVETQDEVYFHRHSVLHDGFDRLTIGLGVRYTAELGEKGLQATSVQIIDRPRTPVEAPFRG